MTTIENMGTTPIEGNSLQDLKERLIQHALYIRSKSGKPIDISGTPLELNKKSYTRIIIEKFYFFHAQITKCAFTYSSFQGSDFQNAVLSDTKFIYCNLSGCNFSGAQLSGVSIMHSNAKASKVSKVAGANSFFTFDKDGGYSVGFSKEGQVSHGTNFSNSDFRGADLRNADLRGADFSAVNLEGCNLAGANLEGADFSDANLANVDWSGANVKNVKLEGATFSLDGSTQLAFGERSEFRQYVVRQQTLKLELTDHESWVRSSRKDGAKAIFTGRQIRGCDFRYRTLAATEFADADIRASRFDEAVLVASNFDRSKIGYCNFDGIDARGFHCKEAEFTFCSFVGADFTPLAIVGQEPDKTAASNFTGATFRNCDFTDAKITSELLKQANFVNCKRN